MVSTISPKTPFIYFPYITNRFAAEIAIMLVFILWGANFTATKICLQYTSPLIFTSLR